MTTIKFTKNEHDRSESYRTQQFVTVAGATRMSGEVTKNADGKFDAFVFLKNDVKVKSDVSFETAKRFVAKTLKEHGVR